MTRYIFAGNFIGRFCDIVCYATKKRAQCAVYRFKVFWS